MTRKSCLIIAGEKSGEDHCMSFFSDLRKKSPDVDFFGVGGDRLQQEGMEILYHLRDFSSWGITDVIGKIPFYLRARRNLLEQVKQRGCKVAILIDFQDFNLSLAKKLKKLGVNVLYYVAPQAWAWRSGRAKTLEDSVHTLFSILPFEKEWFQERGVNRIKGVVHPVLQAYKSEIVNLRKREFPVNRKIKVAILPGSRNFEVTHLLPPFLQAVDIAKKRFQIETHLVKTNSVDPKVYENFEKLVDVVHSSDQIVNVLKDVDCSIASSGTVTLMAALFGVPTVVCYKLSLINELFYRLLVPYRGFISLANIVHQQEFFPEIIQRDVTPDNIAKHLLNWFDNRSEFEKIIKGLESTSQKLSGDDFCLSEYMSEVVQESYGKN